MVLTKINEVYSTIFTAHGHGDKYEQNEHLDWKEIESLSDKDVIKIGVGEGNSVYLGSDGVVYACGFNFGGECGLGRKMRKTNVPTEIRYFRKRGINIVDIATAFSHSLALDATGKVYSWGENAGGQCGVRR